jgi:sugar transferase (PEP-CTERM/EpsH1 system associated)
MTGSNRRPVLLYLVHRAPFPPDKGDRIRTYQFLRYLAQRFEVHLACLADEPVERHVLETLERFCKRVAVANVHGAGRWARALWSLTTGRTISEGAFSSSKLRQILRRWARDTHFDVALASASSLVPYLRLPDLVGIPAVVDLIDVDSEKWFNYAAARRGPKSWLYRLEGRRLRRLEQGLPSWAKAITLVSEAEVDIYRRFCSDGVVRAIGNGVDLDYFRPQAAPREQGCVFLGALDYWPNVDGIEWFCHEIWPEMRRRHPEATVSLVGRRPAPAVCRLAGIPGVKLVGQVPDVRPHLASAAVSIVPLRIARGIQNKVLEALAMGKATVTSPQALEGLHAQPGKDLLCAAAPQEWIEAISRLLGDSSLRQRIGGAGRRYVSEFHRWEKCLEPLDALLGLQTASTGTHACPPLSDPGNEVVKVQPSRSLTSATCH